MAKINYIDNINVEEKEATCLPVRDLTQTIRIQGEVKVFAKKFKYSEADCIITDPPTLPSKGDDVGFTLVFGNYGEFNYVGTGTGIPTAVDVLTVDAPAYLKLMSLCIGDGYRLMEGTREVKACDIFHSGPHNLQVEKNIGTGGVDNWISDFDLPCHYVCCISMLFQIEFPACPSCSPQP